MGVGQFQLGVGVKNVINIFKFEIRRPCTIAEDLNPFGKFAQVPWRQLSRRLHVAH